MLVHKIALTEPVNDLLLPKHAQLLTVQLQKDVFTLWYKLEAGDEEVNRRVLIIGTGESYPSKYLMYISTVQMGTLVWHLFEDMGYESAS
jgi:hypothetical protein